METTVYINNNLYKVEAPNGQMLNLNDGSISSYNFSSNGISEESIKKQVDGTLKIKKYNITTSCAFGIPTEIISKVSKVIGVGKIDNFTEIYYGIFVASEIDDIAQEFSLSPPVSSALVDDSWKINYASEITNKLGLTSKSSLEVKVLSVVFNDMNVATRIKMYRGNYTPTEEEINTAKLYWAENPL